MTPAVEVEAIRTGELRMPYVYAYRPEGNPLSRLAGLVRPAGKALRAPCVAYVLRHPEAGTILVDTGFHRDAASARREDFGLPMSVMFGGLKVDDPFDDQLRARGVDPGAVERVVMTHLHVDHTSGMRLLPSARFTIARAEWSAATARGAVAKGFVGHHLPDESRVDLVDPGEPHGPFARTLDLLGDGSVRLIATPGHTPGHMSLLLRAAGGRTVLLVGDAAYTLRNVREGILPLLTASDRAYRESLSQLAAFAEREPEATLVPSHDPDAWRELQP
ncbi:MAG TPA: N-acyl homoserine lactonase family protein [Thermoleophilaceae bacterium]